MCFLVRSHHWLPSDVFFSFPPSLLLLRGRPSGGKVRHKRQALQDMARPLKQWLYKHRDNPYPTKTEKILLALGSQMTLVQVSLTQASVRKKKKRKKGGWGG